MSECWHLLKAEPCLGLRGSGAPGLRTRHRAFGVQAGRAPWERPRSETARRANLHILHTGMDAAPSNPGSFATTSRSMSPNLTEREKALTKPAWGA